MKKAGQSFENIVKYIKKRCTINLNQKGYTMVEVMVGFVILLILISGLTQLIHASSNLHMESIDTKNTLEQMQKEFCKTDYGSLSKTDLGNTKFTLHYDGSLSTLKNIELGEQTIEQIENTEKEISVKVIKNTK